MRGLEMSSDNLDALGERERYPGYFGKVIHTDNMTLVYWRTDAGARLPTHAHPHEQVVSILQGQFELSVSGAETRLLGPGEIAVIPENIEHAGRAVTTCQFLDVCDPLRQGYVTED